MRVTIKQLELLVARINQLTGSPETTYTRIDGKLKSNVGNYYLDQAYGGIKLVRMGNESGGIYVISQNGYTTKPQLYVWMQGFVAGLEEHVKCGVQTI